MLVKLIKAEGIVESAVATKRQFGIELMINTRERYVPFHRAGGFSGRIDQISNQPANQSHQAVLIDVRDDRDTETQVVFVAENDEEAALLDEALWFESQTKDQISIVGIQRDQFNASYDLGEARA